MDRFLSHVKLVTTNLPAGFRLTTSSISRPFGHTVSYLNTRKAGLLLLSASTLSPCAPPAPPSPVEEAMECTSCPWDDWDILNTLEVTFHSVLARIQSWWTNLRFTGANKSSNTTFDWPSIPSLGTDIEYEKIKLDYVRIAQVLISLIGIGLSLSLMYYLVDQINPTAKEKRLARKRAQQLFSRLGVQPVPVLTDYEVGIAVNLVDTRILSTDWDSIGGLDSIIEELQESVIQPFQQVSLLPYPSRLLKPPKGVLLFGPPGCGKTMLARAMARAAKAHFINLQISTLVNMWYGETQKYVEATFSLAYKLQPSIIFIDELDSFLTTRSYTDNESTRMIKTQFMALWDGLLTDDQSRILIVGATNRPDDLDQAILRRLPYKVSVPMPKEDQRVKILSVCLHGEPLALGLGPNDLREIASRTDGLSGSELHELCREAAFCCYRQEKDRSIAENIRLKREHFFVALQKFQANRVGLRPRPVDHHMPLD